MKRAFLIILFVAVAILSIAQEVIIKYHAQTGLSGFYNERSKNWVVQPKYKRCFNIGSYEGKWYWCVQDAKTDLFGIICSTDYHNLFAPCIYTNIYTYYGFNTVPVVVVVKKADYGLLELETGQLYYILSCSYQDIHFTVEKGIYTKSRNGKQNTYSNAQLTQLYRDRIKNYKEEEARKKAEEQAKLEKTKREKFFRDSAAHAEQVQRLASFTLYAKNYVTPKVNEWQKKDEFETIEEYQNRVTGSNREQKIKEWSKEAEDLFIKENMSLYPIEKLTIDPYDADNEVFSIHSPKYGQLLVPVPRKEARTFKEHFGGDIVVENPNYFIENDKIALRSLDFIDMLQEKTYHYNNQAALNYRQYEIDADALDLAPVRITSSTTTIPTIAKVIKPTCDILSPQKGSSYSTPTIKLNYRTNVDPSTTGTVRFYVAGKEVMPIQYDVPEGMSKGATVVRGTEVELPMPQEIGKETAVSVQLVDGYGTWAEMKTISLIYTGEKPKPTLHIFAVGVSEYPAADLQSLSYAAKDANDFVQTITSSDVSMYREVRSTIIVNNEATTRNIQRQLYQLTSRAAQGDVIMLFFSGHGINQKGEGFFMTYDASTEEFYNGLEFAFIRKRMAELSEDKHCKVLIFMDACHSGTMAGIKGTTKDITFAVPGVVGFYSSTASEQSAEMDKMQNGVFTRVLIDGLKGGAKDKNGQVTILTLEAYIKEEVPAKTNRKQTPTVENSKTGDAVLFHIK